MTPNAARLPQARGRLSSTSMVELLVLALERRLNGSFVFETPLSGKSALVVASGRVTKVRTAEPVEPLGRLLTDSGVIDRATLERGLRVAQERKDRLGDTLIQLDAVDRAGLERALREQLGRRLSWLADLPEESAFGFYPNVDLLEDRPECGAEPLSLIWRCIRDGRAVASAARPGARRARRTAPAPARAGSARSFRPIDGRTSLHREPEPAPARTGCSARTPRARRGSRPAARLRAAHHAPAATSRGLRGAPAQRAAIHPAASSRRDGDRRGSPPHLACGGPGLGPSTTCEPGPRELFFVRELRAARQLAPPPASRHPPVPYGAPACSPRAPGRRRASRRRARLPAPARRRPSP